MSREVWVQEQNGRPRWAWADEEQANCSIADKLMRTDLEIVRYVPADRVALLEAKLEQATRAGEDWDEYFERVKENP